MNSLIIATIIIQIIILLTLFLMYRIFSTSLEQFHELLGMMIDFMDSIFGGDGREGDEDDEDDFIDDILDDEDIDYLNKIIKNDNKKTEDSK